jgi:prepilin-type N-terminal cleavage/methylation domain-containing protein
MIIRGAFCGQKRRREGMTLIEVLMGVTIFSISVPIILTAMIFCYGTMKINAHQITALSLARKKIENLMNIQYASLSTTASYYNETNVVLDSLSNIRASILVTVAAAGTNKKSITVAVSWTERGRPYRVALNSLNSDNNVTS